MSEVFKAKKEEKDKRDEAVEEGCESGWWVVGARSVKKGTTLLVGGQRSAAVGERRGCEECSDFDQMVGLQSERAGWVKILKGNMSGLNIYIFVLYFYYD